MHNTRILFFYNYINTTSSYYIYSTLVRGPIRTTDNFFCLTKYELVRTTEFTRFVLTILYVKRFQNVLCIAISMLCTLAGILLA